MRIIITGLLAFVIWSVFSAWIFNDKLLPVFREPVPMPATGNEDSMVADSLALLKASMPGALLVYFDFDKSESEVDPQLGSEIAPFREWLEKYPGSKLVVTGHTDFIGTNEYNLQLGLERAQFIASHILALGIDRNRVITESAGETRPVAGYITEENRAKNRRTEITIKME